MLNGVSVFPRVLSPLVSPCTPSFLFPFVSHCPLYPFLFLLVGWCVCLSEGLVSPSCFPLLDGVCVWTICKDVKLPLVFFWFGFDSQSFHLRFPMQGAQAHCGYLCQRSYSTMGEAEIDHLHVPAPIFIFNFVHGNRSKYRHVAFPTLFKPNHCTVFAV